MKKTNALIAAAALSFATLSGAAFAQAVDVQAGMTVYGPEGATVGVVDKVEGGNAIVNTGTHSVALPLDKFGASEKGPTISVTKEKLDAIVEQAAAETAAKLDAALVEGAAVVDNKGVALGTIDKIDGDNIVLKTDAGSVSLTKKYFTVGQTGLMALVTKEQVAAALGTGQS